MERAAGIEVGGRRVVERRRTTRRPPGVRPRCEPWRLCVHTLRMIARAPHLLGIPAGVPAELRRLEMSRHVTRAKRLGWREPGGHAHLRLQLHLLALQLGEPGHLRGHERRRFPGNRRSHRDVGSRRRRDDILMRADRPGRRRRRGGGGALGGALALAFPLLLLRRRRGRLLRGGRGAGGAAAPRRSGCACPPPPPPSLRPLGRHHPLAAALRARSSGFS